MHTTFLHLHNIGSFLSTIRYMYIFVAMIFATHTHECVCGPHKNANQAAKLWFPVFFRAKIKSRPIFCLFYMAEQIQRISHAIPRLCSRLHSRRHQHKQMAHPQRICIGKLQRFPQEVIFPIRLIADGLFVRAK